MASSMKVEPSIYLLNDDNLPEEQKRIEWNHWNILLPLFENTLLPPAIEAAISGLESLAVADVGTGTGVWLKSLSELLPPTAKLDGFDFETSKFPKPETFRANVTLQFADAREPFQEEFLGRYDVVHVRLLSLALTSDDEWQKAVRNLTNLLRPGGWLLWEDTPWSSWVSVPACDAWTKLFGPAVKAQIARGANVSAITRMQKFFKNAGLVDVAEILKSPFAESLDEVTTKGTFITLQQYWMGSVSRGGANGITTRAQVDELFADLQKAIDEEGCKLSFDMCRTWGRKPV